MTHLLPINWFALTFTRLLSLPTRPVPPPPQKIGLHYDTNETCLPLRMEETKKAKRESDRSRGKTRVMTWGRALWCCVSVCSPIDVFPFTGRTSESSSLLFQTCLHCQKRRFINTYKTILIQGQQTTSVNKNKQKHWVLLWFCSAKNPVWCLWWQFCT